jgi:hypothetical protein
MLSKLFKKSLDDKEQLSKASFFFTDACCNFMMWKKGFTNDQLNFLLPLVRKNFSLKTTDDAAYLITKCMADLQESSTFMDFLHTSKFIAPLDKQYKVFAVEHLMVFAFLEGDETNQQLTYISYIYTDLALGSGLGFQRLANKAHKKFLEIKGSNAEKGLSNAVEIVADALSRTNYR